jgi:hypothetical protein
MIYYDISMILITIDTVSISLYQYPFQYPFHHFLSPNEIQNAIESQVQQALARPGAVERCGL